MFVDTGNPPSKNFSKTYQSGPLSFEYFLDGTKVITNCGFGKNISIKAELISRLTASQSTLTINETSVTKFERSKLINKIYGNSIKNTFKISKLNFIEDVKQIQSVASHNGYEKSFGCIFKRKISIDKNTKNLSGCDELIKKKD